MGRVVAFSELPDYLDEIETRGPVLKATILDTNILITSTYEIRDDYADVVEILDILSERGFQFFATVNTKSEFLEFHRRLLLTENLLDSIDEHSKIKISKNVRAKIQTLKGTLKSGIESDKEKDFIFNDTQLKKIKQEFSAGDHSGHKGWLEICKLFLSDRLHKIESELSERGIEYISQHEPIQREIFHTKIDWPQALSISEKTGVSFSDAMILNAFECSHCPFIVSKDFDIGYAVLADHKMKDAVVPDQLVKDYRHYHFEKF